MATAALNFVSSMNPVDLAVLWFSGRPRLRDLENRATVIVRADQVELTVPVPRTTLATTVMVPKVTLILAAILVEHYVRLRADVKEAGVRSAVATFAEQMASEAVHRALRHIDPEPPMLSFLGALSADRAFALDDIPEKIFDKTRSACELALQRLEEIGLIEDPPWKTIGIGALAVLLGVIPVDFSVRTERGEHLVRTVEIEAPLWGYQGTQDPEHNNWILHLRAVEFAGETLRELAERYLEAWNRHRPGHLQSPAPSGSVKLDSER